MAALLGVLTAAAFGGADFMGGFAARRSSLTAVVFGMLAAGIPVALISVIVLPEPLPSSDDFLRSVAIGIAGPGAVACLYGGLSMGRMSVVAPISAVGGALLPVAWGLASGERPSALGIVGIALVIVAVALVARGPAADPIRGGSRVVELLLAATAGVLFGVILVLFAETSDSSGMWPVLIVRLVGVPLTAVALLVLRRPLRADRADVPLVAGAGSLDAVANVAQLLAVRRGLVSLVAPVAALYPAITVLLARLVLTERVRRLQLAGLVLAVAGLALIAVG